MNGSELGQDWESRLGMVLVSSDEFEELIVKVMKTLHEERERGRLGAEAIVDNRLIKLPAHGRVVFVGDIHGELESVDEVLRRTGSAVKTSDSKRKYLVFLGDLVDRGTKSVEVLIRIFRLKIQHKVSVIMLRGNHELPDVNSRYGFIDEVMSKYPHVGNEIYALCNRLFAEFPHAVLTANGIFAVHGGIPENVSALEQVANLESEDLEQLLWNDPRPEIHGFQQNYGRDPLGLAKIRYFGEDAAESFLKRIGAKVLIRAHECNDGAGYTVVSKSVLTVFSAKYGRPDWKRAYIDTDLSKKIDSVDSLLPDIRTF